MHEHLAKIHRAAEGLAEATDIVAALEDQRPLIKRDAIGRLMQETNPLTGKPHSATSAEAVVESDAIYAAHRRSQRQAEVEKIFARAAYEAAVLAARAALTATPVLEAA